MPKSKQEVKYLSLFKSIRKIDNIVNIDENYS